MSGFFALAGVLGGARVLNCNCINGIDPCAGSGTELLVDVDDEHGFVGLTGRRELLQGAQRPSHNIIRMGAPLHTLPREDSRVDHLGNSRPGAITPRQKDLLDALELPRLPAYPVPPNSSSSEPEEVRKRKLLEMFQKFVMDLHIGMYLTQINSNRCYSDIHCQLIENMQTLKLDQSNGRIIEFPLTGVTRVHRMATHDKAHNGIGVYVEHIVVVEFMKRRLAFVFKELQASLQFHLCMELLIRRAQQSDPS
eukprot:NODE_13677_length_1152_cov_6.948293.p1 GENE.NODE_13677_length_1152_cov_6.948293~~NODE_13677_length_1152_cov_6.948293.p1  ORF type:complete len:252 (+),score=37.21 NODE_13677_length_1152_cov_6.948293:153-908(+)